MRLAFASASIVVASSSLFALGACGSSGGQGSAVFGGHDGGVGDGGVQPFTTEAPHTPLPILVDQGGPVLTAPAIVTVLFPNDANASTLQSFGQTLASNPWWDAVRAGYCNTGSTTLCVGDGPPGTNATITTPPAASYDDAQGTSSALKTYLTSLLTTGAIPAPTDQTLLVFYFPVSTTINLVAPDGSKASSCQQFGGYHDSFAYNGKHVPYAIVPECGPPQGSNLTAIQSITFAASHEVIEAATDPFITASTSGYYLNFNDPTILPWNNLGGGEVADMCLDLVGFNQDQATENGFTVQRSWSNAAAAAGHDPCVPAGVSTGPYFNVAPEVNAQILVMDVGTTRTFEADAFSDGALPDWYVAGIDEAASQTAPNPYLTIKVDGAGIAPANNGKKLTVSVTLNQDPAPLIATKGFPGATGILISINSSNPQTATAGHIWPFLVTTPGDALDAGLPPDAN